VSFIIIIIVLAEAALWPIVRIAVDRTLHVADEYAHGLAEDEVLQQCRDEGERHTEDGQQQVADGEVQQEQVGDGPHAAVVRQCRDHQRVAGDRQHEDDRIQEHSRVSVVREPATSGAAGPAAAAAVRRGVPTAIVLRHRQQQQPRRRRHVVLHWLHHAPLTTRSVLHCTAYLANESVSSKLYLRL